MTAAAHLPMEKNIQEIVQEASERYNVDPLLVRSVIRVESNFNPLAVSPKGAQGLMQLMPSTANRFGVDDAFDAKKNIEGGVRYLRYLQDRFPGDLRLRLAAYNAGEGAVAKYKDVPPYPETMDYVERVNRHYESARAAMVPASINANVASTALPAEEPVRHVEQFFDAEGRLHLVTR